MNEQDAQARNGMGVENDLLRGVPACGVKAGVTACMMNRYGSPLISQRSNCIEAIYYAAILCKSRSSEDSRG